MTTTSDIGTAIAVNRFGLGVRPDEALPGTDARHWLLAQFERFQPQPVAWAAQPRSGALVAAYVEYQKNLRQAAAGDEIAIRQKLQNQSATAYRTAVTARTEAALTTPAPFGERLVHFWANHFAVSTDKTPIALLAGAFEAEAIRPNVFGRFEDMLLAVERHPAMLLYLDQARSIGPDSPAAVRAARLRPDRQRGLNENLAREVLELHTLGVRSGYAQADVTELASALTGWSVAGLPGQPAAGEAGNFVFHAGLHEPGERSVLGRRYEAGGEQQAAAVLRQLARERATARHIAHKLARHFVSDTPPASLVDRLATAFERSQGDLPTVYRALIESTEAWDSAASKFKTPWEWALSSLRGLGWSEPGKQPVAALMTQLGQPIWRPGSPAGYDDTADSWMAPDSLMRRVELAQRIAAQAGSTLDARTLGPRLLPGGVSDSTATVVSRAESPAAALTLLLVSPEFLRR